MPLTKQRTRITRPSKRNGRGVQTKRNTRKTHTRAKRLTDDVSPQYEQPTIIGLLYAEWCGHCQQLKPTWDKLQKHIMNNYKNEFTIVEIEADQPDKSEQITKLEQSLDGKKIETDGYPTIIKLMGGKVDYYRGNREFADLYAWVTGDSAVKEIFGGYNVSKQMSRHRKLKLQHVKNA